jgi:hypothetical protein
MRRALAPLLLLAAATTANAADAPPPKSLLSDETLSRYRTGPSCRDSRAYDEIERTLRAEAGEAESARYMQHDDAPALGRRIATDYDRAAQVAAARACPDQARQFWTILLRVPGARLRRVARPRHGADRGRHGAGGAGDVAG